MATLIEVMATLTKYSKVILKRRKRTITEMASESFDTSVSVSCNGYPSCCGAYNLYGIEGSYPSSKDQARKLAKMFDAYNIGLIIFVDTVGNQRWNATKQIADQSTQVRNPNSGNVISSWTVTRAMVNDIYNFDSKKKK